MRNDTPEQVNDDAAQPKTVRGLSMRAIVAIAIGLGAAIGLAGVYFTKGLERNGTALTTGPEAAAIAAQAKRLDPFLVGDIAAMVVRTDNKRVGDLIFNDVDGNSTTLAQTGQGYRLVNLWATWCAPCREEMPWLDALQAQAGDDAFKVVAISVDGGSDEKPKAFYEEIGIQHLPFYHDPTIGAFNRLRQEGLAFGLPVTLLIDGNNRVVANMNGPAHWSGPDALALVQALKGQSFLSN